ncbi:DEAD/DEAH box helicase [Labrys sp. KNU-23]|uniref:DEAD/DEAH box helicase n=1 Tax=Labrys sp. KNU-23 TaxID=2789216 RepID=UPI0011EFDD2D|nr:DEAD/DEAH box helicase [Labrys sp. KNU-23]QEN90611.1 DEAD/DEAH box helicase [Labrys sp. KNU-23]
MSFAELGLSSKVLAAVEAAGYATPTPIQAQAIPHVLQRRDVLGIAQTGTGKTAAFTLPMLTLLEKGRARARMPRTLILEPTRELAAQVQENFDRYGSKSGLSVALLIGGVSFGDQDAKITRGVDVLIATPGRLLDHVERGKLLLTGVELLVIDEADRMLDMGFIPDIERICKLVPFTRQTLFFTATMPAEIKRITDQFLHNPVQVEVSRPATAATTITQALVHTKSPPAEKRVTLRRLIRSAENLKNAIVFCNRKSEVAILHRSLVRHGFGAVALHGDMDQRARMAALESFRNGEMPILVASDVAARGLDIPDVSHVFNFDVPVHADDYIHRIGRTGRAGRSGWAFTLVSSADGKHVAAIETLIGNKIPFTGDPPPIEGDDEEEIRERPRRGRRERGAKSEEPRSQDKPREAKSRDAKSRDTGSRRERDANPARERDEAPKAPRHEPQPTSEQRRPQSSRPHRRDEDDGPVVIGMGDHVPSFLLTPIRRKSNG